MTDVDDLKKIQDEQRSAKIAEFGEIGLKKDCVHCVPTTTDHRCHILRKTYCKCQVCHFYDKGDS